MLSILEFSMEKLLKLNKKSLQSMDYGWTGVFGDYLGILSY